MAFQHHPQSLPSYEDFANDIRALSLPISTSELHGIMCGYLCVGATSKGEAYLRALVNLNKEEANRTAALSLFKVYSISQQQIEHFDFEFQLLLPHEDEPLPLRAQAFSEWCHGFTQGITLAGAGYHQLHEEESKDALLHLTEFAQLDYEALDVNEDDERAFMEVSEYARFAVLRLHNDFLANIEGQDSKETGH